MAFWPVLWVLLPPRCVSCCVWGSGWLMAAVVRQSPGWLDGKRSFLCVALPWSSRMEEGRQAASHAEPRGGFSGGSSWGGGQHFRPPLAAPRRDKAALGSGSSTMCFQERGSGQHFSGCSHLAYRCAGRGVAVCVRVCVSRLGRQAGGLYGEWFQGGQGLHWSCLAMSS